MCCKVHSCAMSLLHIWTIEHVDFILLFPGKNIQNDTDKETLE